MQTRLKRYFFLTCGIFFLFLGIVGIFLPLLPTTPFLILTAICFNKSSDKFHAWLLNHRVLGPPIVDWQKNRVIKIQYKIFATLMLLGSLTYLILKDSIPDLGKAVFGIFVFGMLCFIWSQKSKTLQNLPKWLSIGHLIELRCQYDSLKVGAYIAYKDSVTNFTPFVGEF